MKTHTEDDICRWIKADEWMMDLLKAAKTLDLPDWWICAGFVRSKIWDVLHDIDERTPIADIDVIYFDPTNTNELVDKKLEEQLQRRMPKIPWSVKNQARMHVINNLPAYSSAVDGIANFPETVTALGVKLDKEDNLLLTAPHGIEDVIHLNVNPTPRFRMNKELTAIYEERILKKNWAIIWTKLKINFPAGVNE